MAVLAGGSFAASAWIAFGFYDVSVWGPLAFGWLALLLGLALARPALPSGSALAATTGIGVLAVWSLLSTRWAESTLAALTDADRWLFYAAVLVALLLLLRGRSLERPLLAGTVIPLLGLGGYLLVRMIFGDGPGLFLNNRLADPLSYINGTAAYLLLGVWPLVAVAERSRSASLAAAAVGCCVPLVGLAVMTQSRGGLAALVISVILVLALLPGRVRRGWALLVVLAGLAATLPALSDVVASRPPGVAPSEHSLRVASLALLGAGFGAAVVWFAALRVIASLPEGSRGPGGRRAATGILLAIAAIGLIAGALPFGSRVDEVKRQYDDFTQLRQVDPGQIRLSSGGGNRYDYWRIAWGQFSGHPIGGVGAGNYDSTYYLERRTAENIHQPHSIELQAFAETGVIGAAAIALFAAGVLAGAWKRARAAPERGGDLGLAVAGSGVFLYWLLHSSVDWIHLIPGATGIALCGAAVVLAPAMREIGFPSMATRVASVAALVAAVVLASTAIAVPVLVSHRVSQGYAELRSNPAGALDRARQARSLDGDAMTAYYLQAAAMAREDRYVDARDTLLEAARREPHNFVTWGLLGDLALRAGLVHTAINYYREALALNPRDAGLAELARGGGAVAQAAR